MLTVCCVLRFGGDYDALYVDRLWRGVIGHLPINHRFICLTDVPLDVEALDPDGGRTSIEIRPLDHDWPGWWSKLELFRLPGPLLYFDLDTVIVGDIEPIARHVQLMRQGDLLMIRDFYNGNPQSGILGWNGDQSGVARAFVEVVASGSTWATGKLGASLNTEARSYRGDGEWIRHHMAKQLLPVTFAQDVLPGIYSAKADIHAKHGGRLPADARIVCFHGVPRPHQLIPAPAWLREHWGAAA